MVASWRAKVPRFPCKKAMTHKKTTVLIIEDDAKNLRFLNDLLCAQNYEAVCFDNANAALEWLKINSADLILLDIDLPGLSGMQFCRIIKENQATASLPVIMLTAAGDERHRVEGLKTGADDYVVKPFMVKEFMARIEAVLRRYRHEGKIGRKIIFKKIEMDLDRGDALIDGEKVYLLPKEYALLEMFLKKPGHVLAYSFIADEVWGNDAIATRDTIKVTIHRLKEKLGRYADYIQPALGQGYKWLEDMDDKKK